MILRSVMSGPGSFYVFNVLILSLAKQFILLKYLRWRRVCGYAKREKCGTSLLAVARNHKIITVKKASWVFHLVPFACSLSCSPAGYVPLCLSRLFSEVLLLFSTLSPLPPLTLQAVSSRASQYLMDLKISSHSTFPVYHLSIYLNMCPLKVKWAVCSYKEEAAYDWLICYRGEKSKVIPFIVATKVFSVWPILCEKTLSSLLMPRWPYLGSIKKNTQSYECRFVRSNLDFYLERLFRVLQH